MKKRNNNRDNNVRAPRDVLESCANSMHVKQEEASNQKEIREQKKALRKEYLKIRDALTVEYRAQASKEIFQQLACSSEFSQAETIFTYVSYKSEVDTHEIIRYAIEHGKRVAVPRCVPGSRKMCWHAISSLDELREGTYGILESANNSDTLVAPPTFSNSTETECTPCALALVPGATFDAHGYRIGYGGGYYDVFLQNFAGVSVGLCYEVCFSHKPFLTETHDVPVNQVLMNEV